MTLLPSILGYVMVLWRQCKLTFLDFRWFTALKGQCPGSIILLVASFTCANWCCCTWSQLWHSQDTTKTISAIIDGTTTKTSFIAQYVDEREIFHIFFKENANKWVLHTRKKMCAKMSSKLYCSKFYNKNVPYFNIKLTCFT